MPLHWLVYEIFEIFFLSFSSSLSANKFYFIPFFLCRTEVDCMKNIKRISSNFLFLSKSKKFFLIPFLENTTTRFHTFFVVVVLHDIVDERYRQGRTFFFFKKTIKLFIRLWIEPYGVRQKSMYLIKKPSILHFAGIC